MARQFVIKDQKGEQCFCGVEICRDGDSMEVECEKHPILSAYDFYGRRYLLEDTETGEQFENYRIGEWTTRNRFLFRVG